MKFYGSDWTIWQILRTEELQRGVRGGQENRRKFGFRGLVRGKRTKFHIQYLNFGHIIMQWDVFFN